MMQLQRYQQAKTTSVDQTGSNFLQYHHEEKINLNKHGEFQHPELIIYFGPKCQGFRLRQVQNWVLSKSQ